MKKYILLIAILVLSLTGCSRVPEWWNVVDHDHSLMQENIDAFFQAVDAHDAEAVKAMFAPNVITEDEDMDEMIERLFALYSGPTDDCFMQTSPNSSRHVGWKRRANTHNWFPVVSGGVNYYCYFSYTYRDDENPDNEGLEQLVFVTEKARCSEELWYGNEKIKLGNGLTVIDDTGMDYETCRIGINAFAYTPIERSITKDDILQFAENNNKWEDFKAHFGEPNSHTPNPLIFSYYYRLPDENGEKRYAEIGTHSKDDERTIYNISIWDDKNSSPLEILYNSYSKEK